MSIEAKFAVERDEFDLAVELEFPAAGITGLFGPSGSGKTTILRAVAGLDRHEGGYLKVADSVWQDDTVFVPPHKRGVGYVFQEANLFSHLNVRSNLEYGMKRAGRQNSTSFGETVDLLGLSDFVDRSPESLSGGERQRVALARAVLTGPKLLLMDEPLASLDSASKSEILPFLESVNKELGIPTIYVSHSLEEIARLSDYLVLLEKGAVRASGPVKEMLTRLDLPISQGFQAEALVEARVARHESEFALTDLEFDGGTFTVPRNSLPEGAKVRLRIFARDVSLTLEKQTGTSIQNIFEAEIDEINPQGDAQMMVRLRIGTGYILSRITRKSAVELNLSKGKNVFAQVKSVVLLDQ